METIASTLEKVVARSLKRANSDDAPLFAWPLACGSVVAARTRAVRFQAGVLSVEVPDKAWRAELVSLAPRYVAALNRYSPAAVDRVEFVVTAFEPRTQK